MKGLSMEDFGFYLVMTNPKVGYTAREAGGVFVMLIAFS